MYLGVGRIIDFEDGIEFDEKRKTIKLTVTTESLKETIGEADENYFEETSTFALERHLEDFLIENWSSTDLGKTYDIYEQDGEIVGKQYPTDTGPIDILAISKDKKEFLVIELKKGRASDTVVEQIQRYMGFILDETAKNGETVKGCIIALKDDLKLQRALRVNSSIAFFRYEVGFKLLQSGFLER